MGRTESDIPTERVERLEAKGKASVWSTIAAFTAPAALALVCWAHGLLWGHESAIVTLQTQRRIDDEATKETNARNDRVMTEIRDSLRRLEDKLDDRTRRAAP
jgi:hypothetical protein